MGNKEAKILVICEPNNGAEKCTMKPEAWAYFITKAVAAGFEKRDFIYMELVKEIPESEKKTPAKQNKFIKPIIEEIRQKVDFTKYSAIIALGGLAAYAATGSPVKITQSRGTPIFGEPFIFPMFGPSHAMAYPENEPIFESDLFCFKAYQDNGFKPFERKENKYEWCEDLTEFISRPLKIIAIDTETTGLRSPALKPRVLTVQLSDREGESFVCPIDPEFWDWSGREEKRLKLVAQIAEILKNPNIKKIGHSIKYDLHVLEDAGFEVNGVGMDTELMAWAVDENMFSKSLDNCIRRWVPHMAGFNDYYNESINKEDMLNANKDDLLIYAGNDPSATITLFYKLDSILKKEPKHRRNMYKLKMPMLRLLYQMERNGILVDKEYLETLIVELKKELQSLYKELLALIPKKVLINHLNKGLRFTRDDFVRDILFSNIGFGLKPTVFTKGTRDESKSEDKVPSVSVKDHLPFFSTEKGVAGKFIELYTDYTKVDKLLSTYTENFDKYIYEDGRIHANFNLSRTNTGRTSSSDPNVQNFPSRGKWSKPYKKIFVAPEGYSIVSADLSQIELRLIAHRSGDRVLREVYRQDKDVHSLTAMSSMGITEKQWEELSKDDKKLNRFRAKAVNFGFCYSMFWKKFKIYAKTDYGLDYTDEECEHLYRAFFRTYPGLEAWHKREREFVRKHGKVISDMGFVRHLPSIFSSEEFIRRQTERQAINATIQHDASNIGLLGLTRLALQDTDRKIIPVGFVHDDMITYVKEGYEQDAVDALVYVSNQHRLDELCGLNLSVPLKSEPDVGKSLGEMYELADLPKDAPDWVKNIKLPNLLNPKKPSWWNDNLELAA